MVLVDQYQEVIDQKYKITLEHLSFWFYNFWSVNPSQWCPRSLIYLLFPVDQYQEVIDQKSKITLEHLSSWFYNFWSVKPSSEA